MASVSFENVEKVFPTGTRALSKLTLEVTDGELLVLVGPSGSGKSTVLRLVAGLEPLSGGTLRIGDRVANDLTPRERNVAMVFQDYALYPHMTVRGNLEFPLRMRAMPREEIDKRVARAAEVLDIASVLDRLPRQLSGGQQQRVAMGRALVREPAAFLLDEPLSNLDAKLRVEVRAEIGEIQRRTGTTMLYVTHDQTEAMTLGDRVAVLRDGALLQVASPRELYDRPADAFVAGFIGNPPMNLLPAKVVATEGGEAASAVAIAGQDPLPLAPEASEAVRGKPVGGVGIRPEALQLVAEEDVRSASQDRAATGLLRGTVEHIEWLGHETLAHVVLEGGAAGKPQRVVARLAGMQQLERDQAICLAIATGRLHLFDPEGRAIAHPPAM